MAPQEPMLSTSATRWPTSGDWILQPKWDGFRVVIGVPAHGPNRAWSRHGVSLTPRLETRPGSLPRTAGPPVPKGGLAQGHHLSA
jgi:ATP-dependent DNA ligase